MNTVSSNDASLCTNFMGTWPGERRLVCCCLVLGFCLLPLKTEKGDKKKEEWIGM